MRRHLHELKRKRSETTLSHGPSSSMRARVDLQKLVSAARTCPARERRMHATRVSDTRRSARIIAEPNLIRYVFAGKPGTTNSSFWSLSWNSLNSENRRRTKCCRPQYDTLHTHLRGASRSKSEMKPPPASCDGHESKAPHGTPQRTAGEVRRPRILTGRSRK